MGLKRADSPRVETFNSEWQPDKSAVYSHNARGIIRFHHRFFLVPLPPSASSSSFELHTITPGKRVCLFMLPVSLNLPHRHLYVRNSGRFYFIFIFKWWVKSSLSALRNGVTQVKLWRVSRQHVCHQLWRRHTCGSRHYGCNCHRRRN